MGRQGAAASPPPQLCPSGSPGVGAGLREELAHVERYETTVPWRVPVPRAKRDLSVSPVSSAAPQT